MSGVHRGRRGLRWRLVVAVLAASVGRGYQGRHRLEQVALGLAPAAAEVVEVSTAQPTTSQPAQPATVPAASVPTELGAPLPLHVPGTQLAVVPVPPSPDPLVDTMPHPVIRLFPMPVVDHDGSAVAKVGKHEAALADVDAAREAAALADLVNPPSGSLASYHGRHTA